MRDVVMVRTHHAPSYLEQGSLPFLITAQPYMPFCWPLKQKQFVKINLIINLPGLHSEIFFKNHPQTSSHMFKQRFLSFSCQLPHLHMPACIAVTVFWLPNPKTELKQMKEQLKHVYTVQTHIPSDTSSSTMETIAINMISKIHVAFSHFDIFKTIFFTLLQKPGSTSFPCNKTK